MHRLATQGDAAKKELPPSGIIDTGVTVIDKTNVAAFKAELAEMKRVVQ
jgi:ribose transport system substrate-binding protein